LIRTDHAFVRNFLLFLPTNEQPGLKAVLSYYSSAITLNAEGDTSISDDTLEGLGTPRFLSLLFGAIIKIADPPKRSRSFPVESPPTITEVSADAAGTNATMYEGHHAHFIGGSRDAEPPLMPPAQPTTAQAQQLTEVALLEDVTPSKKFSLTEVLPDPGYFAAGALAGAVSRTSTAPLDRLKVYLIANIGNSQTPIDAVKKGDALKAAKHIGQPLIDASRELWRVGGIRSLFAGKYFLEGGRMGADISQGMV
jgi:solute carrier family 25 (mitochondrial phosphate transporter), member 23/24/25/41